MNTEQTARRWFQFRVSSFFWLILCIACFFAGRNWDTYYGKDHLRIRVGQSTTLSSPSPIVRVLVGDPSVCDVVAMSPNLFQVIGKSAGSATIETWETPSGTPTKHSIIVKR